MGTTDVIDNYPGFPQGVNGFELAMQMKEGAERFGAQTQLAEVTPGGAGRAGENRPLPAAATTRPAPWCWPPAPIPGSWACLASGSCGGGGVSYYCATCDGMFYRGKTVVVVGGGNTAVSDVLYLSRLCEKVYLVHRRDTLRASKVYLDPPAKGGERGVRLGQRGKAAACGTRLSPGCGCATKRPGKSGTSPCGGVFVAVGYLPNTQLYRGQVELDEAGYVLADETTQTNLPGVFAVGDLRKKPLRQVVTAASDGAVAAHFIEEYLNQ